MEALGAASWGRGADLGTGTGGRNTANQTWGVRGREARTFLPQGPCVRVSVMTEGGSQRVKALLTVGG